VCFGGAGTDHGFLTDFRLEDCFPWSVSANRWRTYPSFQIQKGDRYVQKYIFDNNFVFCLLDGTCAANAPLNSPCKAWVSAYLAGHAPATDAQEVPRYQADSALARHLSAYHRSDIPAYGAPSLRAQQPFAQNAGLVIVR
jgi:hypothetical protein